MKQELHYFLTALAFFTRIPIPKWVEYSDESLNKSRKYFPAVGWIVGGFSALVFWLALQLLPIAVAVILAVIAGILLTGAFHEDGFADVCDGFGGGYTKEQILRIMKDSRIGVYGAIGMFLLVLLKIIALCEVAKVDPFLLVPVFIAAHSTSRFIASTLVHSHAYVRDTDSSKSRPIAATHLSTGEMFFSFLLAILPLLFLPGWLTILPFTVGYGAKIYLGYYFKEHIGGYTGDCLGAIQQVSEALFYVTVVAIC